MKTGWTRRARARAVLAAAALIAAAGGGAWAQDAGAQGAWGQGAGATDADAAARIQRLEDEAAITRLIVDYGRFLDAQDFASFAALFAEDGAWHGGGGPPAIGPAEIEARMIAAFGSGSGAVWSHDFHIGGNPIVTLEGDRARAVSRWIFVSPDAMEAPAPVLAGRYEDAFVRTAEGWRFAERRLANDLADARFPAIRAEWEAARRPEPGPDGADEACCRR